MMMANEIAVFKMLKATGCLEVLEEVTDFLESCSAEGKRMDEVEKGLVPFMCEMGRRLLIEFAENAGDGDEGETVEREGRRLRRSQEKHAKTYHSVFGKFEIRRWVYAVREGQKAEYLPLDKQLGLPLHEQSYLLEEWLQRLCVQDPYGEAVSTLADLLGIQTSVRCAEQMTRRMAEHIESFQDSLPVPDPATEGQITVVCADGKGVPMRRPLAQRLREELGQKEYPWKSRVGYKKTKKRRTRGDKKVRKQMAYVGAAYTIQPFVRTTDDVLDEILRKQCQEKRPLPQNKRLFAEMTKIVDGKKDEGPRRLFQNLLTEVALRDETSTKKLICLMDGQHSLWFLQENWFPQAIGILDIFHVTEKLWNAAYSLHPQGSVAAEEFVTKYLGMLLDGKVSYVARSFRRLIKTQRLRGSKRKAMEKSINYLENNKQHMKYDEYLRAGYPIGSGVVEGACRHLVKDRMERSGMRWEIEGAQSMLHLRGTYLNGDWKAFLKHRIQTEQTELYGCAT